MPHASRETCTVEDHGVAEDRHAALGDTTVNFVSIRQDSDLAPLLRGLPDDRCQCPHWGYVFEGRLVFTSADGDEVFEAGDAFWVGPGHTPRAEAGTTFLQFSPTDALEISLAAMRRNMEAMQAPHA